MHAHLTRRAALAGLTAGGIGLARGPQLASAQTPVAEELLREAGVVYGTVDGDELVLDFARRSDLEQLRPAVILIHGGSMREGSRTDLFAIHMPLARAGYASFNIDYRLFDLADGTNSWPAQLDDVQRAARWVRANAATYGVDPDRIGALGHSSGGQLAAFLGTRETRDNSDAALAAYSSRASCVVDLSGDMDLSIPYPSQFENEATAALLGGTIAEVPDAYQDFSPITFVDAETVPFLILQGAADEAVPIEHSRRMTEALHAAEIEVLYGEFPGLGHPETADWQRMGPYILAFLQTHLHPAA
jgi:acetyl esterase/lipase